MNQGKVTLVGAGPGDPELLTLKALKAIQQATVLFVDDLVNDEIVAFAAPGARVVYVGKRGGCKSTPQTFIEKLMLTAAREGENVVRLKGGDPFIFGRGGEESQTLAKAGIPFRIVPGITSGVGGLAYAGIPATHRDTNHSVIFLTGHDATGKMPANVNWQAVATAANKATGTRMTDRRMVVRRCEPIS